MCKQSSNPPFIFKSKGGIEKCFDDLNMQFIHKVEDCILELKVYHELGDDGKFDDISEEIENFLSGITLRH